MCGSTPVRCLTRSCTIRSKIRKLWTTALIILRTSLQKGVDQTRGWFFTLHAIATMVFDSVAYKNVISNGLVLDKNGNKMSKRLGNAVDPFGAIEQYGSDPLRLVHDYQFFSVG